ncbi:pentapeptide repeat-containing protein [Oscillatoria salina]|uniref:pentapeptide repeat-containing protein n=1 Tax=Oscillatoria salina TaxID=331517 RepID=UPI0013BC3E1E|nr:pentapeptide repeat-containing protein [Oscillatoria salina]MBZ8179239.1 NACHT domain-containing protein [Oscillatoria salina IIICB1]NET89557.1 NACHT domain-containing protein [Kamptonema sp. SIO1D9]
MSLNIRQWLEDRHIELTQLEHLGSEVFGVAFRIAQDMELKSLTPFDICSLTDVLELPLHASWRLAQPIANLTVGLLRLLSRKKSLKRSEGTWLTFQVAYLNALIGILEQELQVTRPWLNRAIILKDADKDLAQPLLDAELQGLLATLRPGRLSDTQAEQALSLIESSLLVQQMNKLCLAWLVANGAEETQAKLLVQRLVNGLPGYLLAAIAQNPLPLAQLQKFVRLGIASNTPQTTASNSQNNNRLCEIEINLPREEYRANLLKTLSQPLLGENFSLQDIYVPLKGIPLEAPLPQKPESTQDTQNTVNLSDWANSQLQDTQTIAVIFGEPGSGKTSFCQIWAAQIAEKLYPDWMPLFIPLRDVTLSDTFEETLDSALPRAHFSDSDGWLSPQAPPCLLILDGLDELPRSPQTTRHLLEFLDQIVHFRARCLNSQTPLPHKIILTCRDRSADLILRTLFNLTRKYHLHTHLPLSTQLAAIELASMEQEQWRQWFTHWTKLQSKSIAQAYFSFLKQQGLFQKQPLKFKQLSHCIRQPLFLYLLGILHRDGWLTDFPREQPSSELKFTIYNRILQWLLGENKGNLLPERGFQGQAHAYRSAEAIANLLAQRQPSQLRTSMQELALSILQTGKWKLTLQPNSAEPAIARPPLPALLFQLTPHQNQTPKLLQIGFTHRSLGEYLAAEHLAQQLQTLTQKTQNRYGEIKYLIPSEQTLAEQLYRLFGYGPLSPEIAELILERLQLQQQRNPRTFSFSTLFQRLLTFYRAHSRSRWLDEGIVTSTYTHLQTKTNPLNTLQIDAAVGVNVFLLLCLTAKAAQIPFYPCGTPDRLQDFDPDRLLNAIARTAVLSPTCFLSQTRNHLNQLQLVSVCLSQANLSGANLSDANLSGAELIGINLVAANLERANLSWATLIDANLKNANLIQANLSGANLSGANLSGANLSGANLKNACLDRTQLDQQTKNLAQASGAFFSLAEFDRHCQTLALSVRPQSPQQNQLSETYFAAQIESVEGEPILPNAWDETFSRHSQANSQDETIAAPNPPHQDYPPQQQQSYSPFAPHSPVNSQDETIAAPDPPHQDYPP